MRQVENRLIRALPRSDKARLLKRCVSVPLELGQLLCEAGESSAFVYFPVKGFISLLAILEGKPALEVCMVGWEGLVGAHRAFDVSTAPLRASVHGAGSALRLSAAAFQQELDRGGALQSALNRYLYVSMIQIASAAACLQSHPLGQRLARSLLLMRDRAAQDSFHLTHEQLASMLGVRRVSITTSAGLLQKRGFIRYTRGAVTVVDRTGLEGAACSCYAADKLRYAQIVH